MKYPRLRDMTTENEQEQRRRIAEMEKDITGIDDLQSTFSYSLIINTHVNVYVSEL